ncbi:DISARM system SNF2-like helicase DrmD [Ruegeria arenilitoris]|uniref:DISARM system SNF2-like helicase DrmD n=1 Tax=Ruegeria arenilitoris TaxID=1173585 RepID=UPI00147CD21C|nr:DISARM system SNF2-like helicase DrmD [Ruegeria arenilitoris]
MNLETVVAVPEPGQLVEVRRRRWVVADKEASNSSRNSSRPQHRVLLAAIEDDALGEELEVIWEIEPGARILERAGLPQITGRDETRTLEAFLDAVRWGAATSADKGFLQAPFRSGVSIEDYQLDPLVRAIDMARTNLLIADDVGLGKTIEAGLVIQELLLRHRARTVFVVCPASLQEKWRVEMLEKFGLEFKIVNGDYVRKLRRERGIHANPWTSFPRLIVSVDWLKSGEPLRTLKDVLPVNASYPRKFDLLVIDEAHNVAPAGSTHYAMESQRTRLVRAIAPHFQHKLFLTATPHNGFTESFVALLELLDNQRFARGGVEIDERKLSQVMIRRLKTEIKDKNGDPVYPPRVLKTLPIKFTQEERDVHRDLEEYCRSREKTGQASGAIGTKFVNELLKKRLFSSPAALASTLEKHHKTLKTGPEKKKQSKFDDGILKKAIAKTTEDFAEDRSLEVTEEEAVDLASKASPPLTDREEVLLERLRDWAQKASRRADSKAEAIIDWIKTTLQTNGKWNDKRVVLFTEYRTTHRWLHEQLQAHGMGDEILEIIHGGVDQDERERVKAAFQAHPDDSPVRILLATDAASEGIDLQNHCNCLIHVEIPYNPNVMEQRNGRIDRHGQREKEVLIWHPVDSEPDADKALGGHEADILRALEKLDAMRSDMGAVNPVIAPQMAGLIEGSRRELDTSAADARVEKQRRVLRVDRQLEQRVKRLHERLLETQTDFHLTPERVQAAVEVGLALAEKPLLIPVENSDFPAGKVFEMPALTGSWARCLEGLRHPYTNALRPITFDHDVAASFRDDVVLVHLNHRLVQMCLQLMRAEVWANEDTKRLHRVDVRQVSDDLLERPAIVATSRLVITGGNHHRLHEELTMFGAYLDDKGFARERSVTRVEEWLENAESCPIGEDAIKMLAGRYEANASALMQGIEARSRERLRTLETTLNNKKDQELKNITTILDELAKSIEDTLEKEDKPEQLRFDFAKFDEAARMELRRDFAAIRARLSQIPEEKRIETEAIEARYGNFAPRTFPVSVVFLIPASKISEVME